jgi:hypothetical protein
MTKLRLPKPVANDVIHRHLHLGSVYTKEQMRAFAEKAVLAEREACAELVYHSPPSDEYESPLKAVYNAIRNRGNT